MEIKELINKLLDAKNKYESRVGTYITSDWKDTNEGKIQSSLNCINSLLGWYGDKRFLTPSQIALAKKMIKNANALK